MSSRSTVCETFALFLILFPLTLLTWSAAPDSEGALATYAVSDALARYGRWDIEAMRWLGESVGVYGADDLLYARQPPGTSLLALPLLWLGLWGADVGPLHTALLLPPLLHTLTALLLYRSARSLFPNAGRESALAVTLLWAMGSLLLPATRDFGSVTTSSLALVGTLYQLLRYRSEDTFPSLLACGGWLGLALIANPATSLTFPLFGLALLTLIFDHWRAYHAALSPRRRVAFVPFHAWRDWLGKDWVLLRLFLFLLPLMIVVAFYLWYTWQRFGVPFALADWQGGTALLLPLLPLFMALATPLIRGRRRPLLVGTMGGVAFLLALFGASWDVDTPEAIWLTLAAATRRPLALLVGMLLAGVGAGTWGWRRQGGELVLTVGALLLMSGLWLLLGDLRAFESPTLRETLTALPEELPPGAQLWYAAPDKAPALLNQVKAPLPILGFSLASDDFPAKELSYARELAQMADAPIYLLTEQTEQEVDALEELLEETLFFVGETSTGRYRLAEYWQGPLSVPLRLEQQWTFRDDTVLDLREVRATPLLARGGVLAVELRWASEMELPDGYQLLIRMEDAAGALVLLKRSDLNSQHWQPGRVMVERRAFRVPATLSPGRYTLHLTLRPAPDGDEIAIVVTVR
ncbi:MAG: hypothetical protein H0T73_02320 [Ardenticatenales bacterium]|nr:hypothetical protein [Ardenticatenales bacterium]